MSKESLKKNTWMWVSFIKNATIWTKSWENLITSSSCDVSLYNNRYGYVFVIKCIKGVWTRFKDDTLGIAQGSCCASLRRECIFRDCHMFAKNTVNERLCKKPLYELANPNLLILNNPKKYHVYMECQMSIFRFSFFFSFLVYETQFLIQVILWVRNSSSTCHLSWRCIVYFGNGN